MAGKHRRTWSTDKKVFTGLLTFIALDYMLGGLVLWMGIVPVK